MQHGPKLWLLPSYLLPLRSVQVRPKVASLTGGGEDGGEPKTFCWASLLGKATTEFPKKGEGDEILFSNEV